MATESGRRQWVRKLVCAGAFLAPAVEPSAFAQQQPGPRLLPAGVTADANKRVVAFVHGNVPITREDLGEFLIARGGMEKLELLVNKRAIEIEAARRGVTVTDVEVRAGLEDDLRGAGTGIDRAAFTQFLRERYNKSLYEWEQDVIRPRLLLGKICRPTVKVTPEELMRTFESLHGEKREAQIVVWPKNIAGLKELTPAEKDAARTSIAEFDKLAARQPDPGLAGSRGLIRPVSKHIDGEDPQVENALFALKEGDLSPWIETEKASTCIRCTKIIPPADPTLTLDKVRVTVEKEVYDRKLNVEIPKLFAELKKASDPKLTAQVPIPADADPLKPPPRVPHHDPKVLAVLYGAMPITREDLGEFLIARGGYEKLELLVNRRIIELEAIKRGIALTPPEVEAAQKEYIEKLGVANVTMADFVKHVLPRRNLNAFTWTEDIIKPELVIAKMCKERVKIAEDDLQKAFENKYGEKRTAKIILWRKDEFRTAQKQWEEARKSDVEFDRIARAQFDSNLAAAAGAVAPIGRHTEAENPLIEQVVFTLQKGELSQLFETPAGIMCVKCTGTLPPAVGVKLDAVREGLRREVFERKLGREVATFFGELKQAARPEILLKGPPTQREFEEGTRELIQQAVGTAPKP